MAGHQPRAWTRQSKASCEWEGQGAASIQVQHRCRHSVRCSRRAFKHRAVRRRQPILHCYAVNSITYHASPQLAQHSSSSFSSGDVLRDALYSAADMPALADQVHSQLPRFEQQHYRAALSRMLYINQQKQTTGRSRAVAISCLEQLTHQFISMTQPAHSQHRIVTQQFLPDCATSQTRLASWPIADVALLGRVMESYAWCDARVWSQIQSITLCEAPLVMPLHAANLLYAASRLYKLGLVSISAYSNDALCQLQQEWLDAMFQRVAAGASSLYPKAIAQSLHAVADLNYLPSKASLNHTLNAGVLQRLDIWLGPDIACVLWSLANLQHHPGHSWMDSVVGRIEACARSFQSGSSIASLLWALAVFGHAPPKTWMEHVLMQAQRRFHTCNDHALSNIVWALAQLRYRPPNAWSVAFLKAASQRMHSIPASVLCQVSTTGNSPTSQRVSRVLHATSAIHEHSSSQAGTDRDWLGGGDNHRPSATIVLWPPAAQQQQQPNVQEFHSRDWPMPMPQQPSFPNTTRMQHQSESQLNGVVTNGTGLSVPEPQIQGVEAVGMAACGDSPPQSIQQHVLSPQLLSASSPVSQLKRPVRQVSPVPLPEIAVQPENSAQTSFTPTMSSEELQGISLTLLQDALDDPVGWKGSGASSQAFANFLWGISRLQILPRDKYLRRILSAMSPGMNGFRPRDLVSCLCSLQQLRYMPDAQMYALMIRTLHVKLPECDAETLLHAAWAVGRFAPKLQADSALVNALSAHLQQMVETLTSDQLARACSSMARLSPTYDLGNSKLLPALVSRTHTHAQQMQLRTLCNTGWSLAKIVSTNPNIGQQSMADTVAVLNYMTCLVRSNIGSCTHQDLIQAASASAMVNFFPGRDWLASHEAAICRLVARGRVATWELPPLMHAYRDLEYDPVRLLNLLHSLGSRQLARATPQHSRGAGQWSGHASRASHARQDAVGLQSSRSVVQASKESMTQLMSPQEYKQLRRAFSVDDEAQHWDQDSEQTAVLPNQQSFQRLPQAADTTGPAMGMQCGVPNDHLHVSLKSHGKANGTLPPPASRITMGQGTAVATGGDVQSVQVSLSHEQILQLRKQATQQKERVRRLSQQLVQSEIQHQPVAADGEEHHTAASVFEDLSQTDVSPGMSISRRREARMTQRQRKRAWLQASFLKPLPG